MFKLHFPHTQSSEELSAGKAITIGVYIVLCLVSMVMTLLNVFTHKGILTVVTGIFSCACIVNIIFALIGEKTAAVARVMFAAEILAMFSFFLISGNPDGFSAIWICLLPPASLYFFGRKRGTGICAVMLAVLVFFLWIPVGNAFLMYSYNETFCMRFPILFVAFFAVAYFLEVRREKTYLEMKRLQRHYLELSTRDSLTKLYNRQGMYARLKETSTQKPAAAYAIMLDIDDFKHINDTYGHDVGDVVLKVISDMLAGGLKGVVCRWGGEEFVAVIKACDFSENDLEKLRKDIEAYEFQVEQERFHATVSIGVCKGSFEADEIDALVGNADIALYNAKTAGKNRIVYYK